MIDVCNSSSILWIIYVLSNKSSPSYNQERRVFSRLSHVKMRVAEHVMKTDWSELAGRVQGRGG